MISPLRLLHSRKPIARYDISLSPERGLGFRHSRVVSIEDLSWFT